MVYLGNDLRGEATCFADRLIGLLSARASELVSDKHDAAAHDGGGSDDGGLADAVNEQLCWLGGGELVVTVPRGCELGKKKRMRE